MKVAYWSLCSFSRYFWEFSISLVYFQTVYCTQVHASGFMLHVNFGCVSMLYREHFIWL
ncbi:hypothetical protein EG68_12028, partial [Paragonimus skrjabini miyazakii]